MNYTELEAFNTYLDNYETSTKVDALKGSILETAESIVTEYLRWNPVEEEHEEFIQGNNTKNLYLKEMYVSDIDSIEVNDEEVTGWSAYNNRLHRSSKWDPNATYKVTYTSGWGEDESTHKSLVPEEIKVTTYRIASLLWQETSGGIGKSSRTSQDGSVQFFNYTNYAKFLISVDRWRAPLELMEY